MIKITKLSKDIALKNVRLIYATRTPLLVDQKWRREKKLSLNPNKESPLTYLPDFTYMDGRSTPIGRRQHKRLIQQKEFTEKIIAGTSEIAFAKKRYDDLLHEKEEQKNRILKSKLKPKGYELLENMK